MINIFWSILNRGLTCSTGRQVSKEAYKQVDKYTTLHNLLVPPADIAYSSCSSEQILQTVLNSSYRSRLLALDTLNTYDFPLPFPMYTSTMAISTTPVTVTVLKDGITFPWVSREFNAQVYPSSNLVTVTGLGASKTYSYSMADNLSSKIPLDIGLYIRMSGTLPGSDFTINVKCEVPFNRNLNTLLPEASSVPWYNAEYRKLYIDEVNPAEKTAILAFNLYEGVTHG